jgi:hypothetical protein
MPQLVVDCIGAKKCQAFTLLEAVLEEVLGEWLNLVKREYRVNQVASNESMRGRAE